MLHRNEFSDDERATAGVAGIPVVLGRSPGGGYEVRFNRAAPAGLDGSVDGFEAALRRALDAPGGAC
ncbi:MAG: hypothetical protein ACRCXL_06795 [Dermatophilaceae bacterium]